MTVLPAAAPRYVYPAASAASAEVPVYGSSVTVPQVYQTSGASAPTVSYSQAQPMSSDQLKAIFPMGAPTSFTPFTASQYTYNIVDSPSVFVPAAPVATVAEVPTEVATASAETAALAPVEAAPLVEP